MLTELSRNECYGLCGTDLHCGPLMSVMRFDCKKGFFIDNESCSQLSDSKYMYHMAVNLSFTANSPNELHGYGYCVTSHRQMFTQ